MVSISKQRLLVFLSLLLVTPLGFLFKFYHGPQRAWFNNYGAAVWYEIFWCLLIYGLRPSHQATTAIPLGVFAATCGLEILQLWHPPWLETIRSYPFGRFLIGTTFAWWDFPHYLIGCAISWFWLRQIRRGYIFLFCYIEK